jgi:hypothetical protein
MFMKKIILKDRFNGCSWEAYNVILGKDVFFDKRSCILAPFLVDIFKNLKTFQ